MGLPYSYLDYRELMRDRFAELKSKRRGVTHRSLSKKAGFASPNFLKLVMDGKRNLTTESIRKVCSAYEIEGREAEFFAQLVEFNQAKDIAAKDMAYERMKVLRRDLPLKRLEHSQFDYLKNWYVIAIREMVGLKDFREDPEWIRSRLNGKVSLSEVKQSLKLLERLGLVRRDAKGRLQQNQATLTTGDEVASVGVYRFHQGMMKKAEEALHGTHPDFRDISSVTVPLSKNKFQEIKQRLQQFRKEILALAKEDAAADVVYQFNMQFFNLSELLWEA